MPALHAKGPSGVARAGSLSLQAALVARLKFPLCNPYFRDGEVV